MDNPRDIILKPVITERSTELMEQNKYTFLVHRAANKIQIKKALEDIFDVKVKSVNTMNVKGKKRRLGRFPEGLRPGYKKAIVTLKDDSKPIEIFE